MTCSPVDEGWCSLPTATRDTVMGLPIGFAPGDDAETKIPRTHSHPP